MYSKKNIMNNAWNLIKKYGISRSVALKAAWALEKTMVAAEKSGEASGWNHKLVVNDWVKGDHNRTYVSVRLYTNAWNLKREERFGYIDNLTGNLVA